MPYPDTVDDLEDVEPGLVTVEHFNLPLGAIRSIREVLGDDPQGAAASLSARLDTLVLTPGPQGPQGIQGPAGPAGPAGEGGGGGGSIAPVTVNRDNSWPGVDLSSGWVQVVSKTNVVLNEWYEWEILNCRFAGSGAYSQGSGEFVFIDTRFVVAGGSPTAPSGVPTLSFAWMLPLSMYRASAWECRGRVFSTVPVPGTYDLYLYARCYDVNNASQRSGMLNTFFNSVIRRG